MNRLFLLMIIASFGLSNAKTQNVKNVDSKAFAELIASNEGIILDVRTLQEYKQGHIENSTLISTNDPKFVEKVKLLQKDKPLYIYCLTGSRSRAVANYLSKNGYSKVYNLTHGILEWQRYGNKITQSASPIANTGKTYSELEFNKLLQSKDVVLVDFHAPWCAPCKKMAPIIEELRKDYSGKAAIEKIDVQANKTLQNVYKVESIPGLILFKNGKEVWKYTGVISYVDLSKKINQYL
jgi:thioredoxin 1